MMQVGVDVIEIARIQEAIGRWGDRFLNRVYTPEELKAYKKSLPSLAARFAAKEAVMKALGASSLTWTDIEVLSCPDGRPFVHLYGEAQRRAGELGLDNLAISLSHSREYAIAFVAAGT